MKKRLNLFFILLTLLILTACGITEELEQAKNAVHQLKTSLTTQKEDYEELISLLGEVPAAFSDDLSAAPGVGLYPEQTGAVYENIASRELLFNDMSTLNKDIEKIQKELQRIVKKHGADVDNKQLTLIDHSLQIILSNFASLQVYVESNQLQESQFFEDLPIDTLDAQLSIIQRTYGAIEIVSEEAQANIDYTLALINTFETQAPISKEKRK